MYRKEEQDVSKTQNNLVLLWMVCKGQKKKKLKLCSKYVLHAQINY